MAGNEQPIILMENNKGISEIKVLNESSKNEALWGLQKRLGARANVLDAYATKVNQLSWKNYSTKFKEYADALNDGLIEALKWSDEKLVFALKLPTTQAATAALANPPINKEETKTALVDTSTNKGELPTAWIGNISRYAKGGSLEERMKKAGL